MLHNVWHLGGMAPYPLNPPLVVAAALIGYFRLRLHVAWSYLIVARVFAMVACEAVRGWAQVRAATWVVVLYNFVIGLHPARACRQRSSTYHTGIAQSPLAAYRGWYFFIGF